MTTFEAVRTILAVRSYKDLPIPADSIRRIIEAARLSPSARNRQPWHFVVIDDSEAIQHIASLAKTGPYIAGAPLVIAAAVESSSKWALSDISRAIQSMVLTAWEEGIGSNWVGFGGLGEIAELLGIPPEYELLAVLPFGYPADKIGKGEKVRKPVGEIASYGQFGTPYGDA